MLRDNQKQDIIAAAERILKDGGGVSGVALSMYPEEAYACLVTIIPFSRGDVVKAVSKTLESLGEETGWFDEIRERNGIPDLSNDPNAWHLWQLKDVYANRHDGEDIAP